MFFYLYPTRLQKQKEEDVNMKANALTEKNTALEAECEASRNTIQTLNEELEQLKIVKQSLEVTIKDLFHLIH